MRKIAELFALSQSAARVAARLHALEEAAAICDRLTGMGNVEHVLGAAECANLIRQRLKGR